MKREKPREKSNDKKALDEVNDKRKTKQALDVPTIRPNEKYKSHPKTQMLTP